MIYWWEKAFLLAVLGRNSVVKKKTERRWNLNGDDTWISKKFESHLVCTQTVEKEDHKDVSWESLGMTQIILGLRSKLTKTISIPD